MTFLRVEGAKNPRVEDAITQDITASIGASGQCVSGNVNEDSIDAATAILDAASINPTLDQVLNQEQIRYAFWRTCHLSEHFRIKNMGLENSQAYIN